MPKSTLRGLNIALGSALIGAATILLAGTSRGQPSAPPTLAELQVAYEKEATGLNAKKHDLGLKLWETNCREAKGQASACSVSFFSASDPEQTLYMDIALVEPANGGWLLKSGLCRK